MNNFDEFIAWEKTTRDTLDVKKIYIDIANDVLAGIALSEIIYWYLPGRDGSANKLRIEKEGRQWIAVRRYEWWERTRFSPRQADRAIGILVKLKLIVKDVFKFYGEPTLHISLEEGVFLEHWNRLVASPSANPFLPIRNNVITQKEDGSHESVGTLLRKQAKPLTENTTKTTALKDNMPLEWQLAHGADVTQEQIDNNAVEVHALQDFERQLGFGTLPWDSTTTWTKFAKFIVRVFSQDNAVWSDYKKWREDKGKYKAFSNRKIRENPAAFMDTGYPEFEASKKYEAKQNDWFDNIPKPI